MRSKRALRLLGVTVLACVAMGALAGSAQAYEWIYRGEVIPENKKEEVECNQVEPFFLTGSIGSTKVPVEVEFETVTCEEWKIWNSLGEAYSLGELDFQGATMLGELGTVCGVTAGLTKPLTGKAESFPKLKTTAGLTLAPEEGFTNWIVLHITGASCPIAGNRPVRGIDTTEVEPGEFLTNEIPPWAFSAEVQAATGSSLEFAGNQAVLTGELKFMF